MRFAGFGFRALAVAACSLAVAGPALAQPQGKKLQVDTPKITVVGATQLSLDIEVCAGPSGAAAGFSLQWMTCEEYAENGNAWYASDDPRLCKASFSGNAFQSNYNLGPNQCVTVTIGLGFLEDNGAKTNCNDDLECGTCYVFRAFAHADKKMQRSDFTGNLTAETSDCGPQCIECACMLSQGYWKNHPDEVVDVEFCGELYEAADVLDILNSSVAGGNSLAQLAHQTFAALISLAVSELPIDPELDDLLQEACDHLFGKDLLGFEKNDDMSTLAKAIGDYIGAQHCN